MRSNRQWLRLGNVQTSDGTIIYRPISSEGPIKDIIVLNLKYLSFISSPITVMRAEVNKTIFECFPERNSGQHIENYDIACEINFTPEDFEKVKIFFKKINDKFKPAPFDDEIIQELENLLHHKPWKPMRHLIPEPLAFVSIANYATDELINLLKKIDVTKISKSQMKQIRTLLTQGADPNELNNDGVSAFNYVAGVGKCNVRLLELLTNYGDPRRPVGNPFDSQQGHYVYTAIELALYFREYTNSNVFLSKFPPPQKSVISSKIWVKNTTFLERENEVLTCFELSTNQNLYSRVKKLDSLTTDEKLKIYPLVKKYLFGPAGDKEAAVKADFNETFFSLLKRPNDCCEILFIKDEKQTETYVGFRHFTVKLDEEKPLLPNFPYRTICDLTVIESAYQQLGIGFFISAIPAMSLQLFRDQGFLIWSALNYKSFPNAIDNFFPKLKPEAAKFHEPFHEFIGEKYPDATFYDDETMTSFIHEPYATATPTPNTLQGRFLEGEIKGYRDMPRKSKDEVRGIPVIIPLGDEFFKFIAITAVRLGIDLASHICEFGIRFAKLFDQLKNIKPDFSIFKRYPRSRFCLFHNLNEPQTINLLSQSQTQFPYQPARISRL